MIRILQQVNSILTRAERREMRTHIVMDALISVLDVAAIVFLLYIVNFYTQPVASAKLKFLPGWMLNRNSVALIIIFFAAFSIKNLFAHLLHRGQYHFVYRVACRLSTMKLAEYLRGPFSEQVAKDSSVFIRNISQQPIEFSQHVLAGIQQIITQLLLVIITVTVILIFNVKLFFLLLLLLTPPVILTAILIKKNIAAARKNIRTTGQRSLQHLKEALAGYVESNIYGKEKFFSDRYIGLQEKLNSHIASLQVMQGMPGRLLEIFAVLGFALLLLISQSGIATGTDILTVGMFVAAAYKIIPGVVKILNNNGQVRTYDYTIADLKSKHAFHSATNKTMAPIRSIQFQNISFQYQDHPILKNFTGKINPGKLTGISGTSGKGKTTLINLLLGFIEPHEGQILINGELTSASDLKLYWPNISYVKQDVFLINDSIANNISLCENDFDNDRMATAIKLAGIEPLIDRYTDGVRKLIAENGKDISGGQKQRIAIARALYRDSDLIILDEPFNELDKTSESDLLTNFRNIANSGKMVILITHSRESLSQCDEIINLDEA